MPCYIIWMAAIFSSSPPCLTGGYCTSFTVWNMWKLETLWNFSATSSGKLNRLDRKCLEHMRTHAKSMCLNISKCLAWSPSMHIDRFRAHTQLSLFFMIVISFNFFIQAFMKSLDETSSFYVKKLSWDRNFSYLFCAASFPKEWPFFLVL